MTHQTYNDIVTPELLEGAIENREFHGFLQDYHVLHCLIRKYQPISFFEIGTNMGTGTQIIKNAIGEKAVVFSLELPMELTHESMKSGTVDLVGHHCKLPYVQFRGDSMTFDFSKFPSDGYFVDGCHEEFHVYRETMEALSCKPKIVVYHDSDIPEVMRGIASGHGISEEGSNYDLYRVQDTRIAYLLRK